MADKTSAAAVILASLALIVSAGGNLATRQAQIDAESRADEARRDLCVAVNATNAGLLSYIGQQIARSRVTLPTLEYYREHPDELAAALESINQQAADTAAAFPQRDCDEVG